MSASRQKSVAGASGMARKAAPDAKSAKKKSKKPMIIGFCSAGIVLILAAVLLAVVLSVSPVNEVKGAFLEYENAFYKGDFLTHYSYDYTVVCKYGDVEANAQDAEEYYDLSDVSDAEIKVIAVTGLSSSEKETLKRYLEDKEFLRVDEISDIRLVTYRYKYTQNGVEVMGYDTQYAIKVGDQWYFK